MFSRCSAALNQLTRNCPASTLLQAVGYGVTVIVAALLVMLPMEAVI